MKDPWKVKQWIVRAMVLVLACGVFLQSGPVGAQDEPVTDENTVTDETIIEILDEPDAEEITAEDELDAEELTVEGEPVVMEAAISTAFVYHGNLTVSGSPANGTFDLEFRLFDALTGGNLIGAPVARDNVPVANGVFQVTLGFGANAFNGQQRWLEIRVRNGSSTGAYTTLTPRREILAVPYATYSANTRGIAVAANGRVGIGANIASPLGALHVRGPEANGTNQGALVVQDVQEGHRLFLDGNEINAQSNLYLNPDSGGNINMAGGGGRVGIGTASPSAPLHVHSAKADTGFRISASGKSTSVYLHVANGDYGFLDLGGGTRIRGKDRESVFAGRVSVPTLRIRGGADLAEPFTMTDEDAIEPGMVVAIDPEHPGQLRLADKAYDRGVAGVVSGAGGIQPGITLQQEGTEADGEHPVSLSGRVYVWADASYGAIAPTDLLTTSDTPGHAMKVTDYERAQGAILGKAMSSLEEGTGLVLVLVSLQ